MRTVVGGLVLAIVVVGGATADRDRGGEAVGRISGQEDRGASETVAGDFGSPAEFLRRLPYGMTDVIQLPHDAPDLAAYGPGEVFMGKSARGHLVVEYLVGPTGRVAAVSIAGGGPERYERSKTEDDAGLIGMVADSILPVHVTGFSMFIEKESRELLALGTTADCPQVSPTESCFYSWLKTCQHGGAECNRASTVGGFAVRMKRSSGGVVRVEVSVAPRGVARRDGLRDRRSS